METTTCYQLTNPDYKRLLYDAALPIGVTESEAAEGVYSDLVVSLEGWTQRSPLTSADKLSMIIKCKGSLPLASQLRYAPIFQLLSDNLQYDIPINIVQVEAFCGQSGADPTVMSKLKQILTSNYHHELV
jgi:hypothetical protein